MFLRQAVNYYLSSIPTLFKGMDYFSIPTLLFKNPLLLNLRGGMRLYVENLMDIWTIKEVVLDRQYEQVREIKKGGIVIDIGASLGDFSILAAKQANRVYAFECNPKRVRLMKKNLRLNYTDNVVHV